MNPADYIKRVRKSFGMTQTEFAKMLFPDKDPKKAQSYISRYESGQMKYSADTLMRIISLVKLNMQETYIKGKENLQD